MKKFILLLTLLTWFQMIEIDSIYHFSAAQNYYCSIQALGDGVADLLCDTSTEEHSGPMVLFTAVPEGPNVGEYETIGE
jgi:hypothetical protein